MDSFLRNYPIYRLVRDLHKDSVLRERFGHESQTVIKDYRLTPEQSEAIINRDYPKLYRLGVHPLILFNLWHIIERNPDVFRQQIVPKLGLDEYPSDC